MKKHLILIFFFSAQFSTVVFGQKNYFQQEVNYKIDVKLDDKTHSLKAFMEIEYTNNSLDQLNEIYFHLWPNAYKNNSTALAEQLLNSKQTNFYYAKNEDRGFIDSLDFRVTDKLAHLEYDKNNIDIAKLILHAPILPGEKIIITTPFYVKLPKGIYSRLGHLDQSYQITQWYPKPAVYDKNGWNQMPYLNQGEFYSEFGSFDVSITLPKNYVVGATGDLIDGQEELEWLSNLAKSTELKTEFNKEDNSYPASELGFKTLRYKQYNVHDFAWFADKRWHVLKGEVELPHSKNKVTLWAMFTNADAELWKKSIEYLHDAIYYYSLWNGDYPYNQVTAVDGALTAGGGMEYPNVTVIGSTGSAFSLETVIMHEVGHNWFYGILGSNERVHPWMDEGLNSFNENRYIETKYPDKKLIEGASGLARFFDLDGLKHKAQYELSYLVNARRALDQPIELHSADYTNLNYGGIVYSKTAIVFDYLMAYLGEETFDKAMKTYFERWKFKHPQPEDLKAIFEEVSQKNLDWFFGDIITTTKKIDYKIATATFEGSNYSLSIKNKGEIESPFSISAIKENTIVHTVWQEGFQGKKQVSFPGGDYDKFKIDAQLEMPEINRKNNTLKTKGLFKKAEPFKLQLLGSAENPEKTQLFYTPLFGWNAYNKSMLGMAFYNTVFPHKKFEYALAPLFAFGTKSISGMGYVAYNLLFNNGYFHNIRLSNSYQRFAYSNYTLDKHYSKLSPKIEFELQPKSANGKISKTLSLRSVNILKENEKPSFNENKQFIKYVISTDKYMVNELSFEINDKQVLFPKSLTTSIEQGKNFIKASLEGKYQFSYQSGKKKGHLRVFAGKFISNKDASSQYYFSMNGNNDYLFDHLLLGRSDVSGLLSHQFAMKDGGFRNYVLLMNSNDWLASLNLTIALPFKFPLSIYGDLGLAPDAQSSTNTINKVWNTGIALSIVPKHFEVYFPLASSTKFDSKYVSYSDRIRFVLNINELKPFKLLRKFDI